MVRRLFTIISALSLLLCAATTVLWSLSYRHPRSFEVHSHHGARWYGGFEAGEFLIYNETTRLMRELATTDFEVIRQGRKAADLHARWQRRPDRFGKSKDSLMADWADAEFRQDRGINYMVETKRKLYARGTAAPVRHSIRCSGLEAVSEPINVAFMPPLSGP
jgi:hypothetical protein